MLVKPVYTAISETCSYMGGERESCVKPETASLCLYNVVALLQSKSPSNVSAHIRPQGITPTNKWKGEKSAA